MFLRLCLSVSCVMVYCFCSIRDITKEVAAAVVREAVAEDLAEGYRDMDARELRSLSKVRMLMYCPLDLVTCL